MYILSIQYPLFPFSWFFSAIQVFDNAGIANFLDAVLDGYHATVFAYGPVWGNVWWTGPFPKNLGLRKMLVTSKGWEILAILVSHVKPLQETDIAKWSM